MTRPLLLLSAVLLSAVINLQTAAAASNAKAAFGNTVVITDPDGRSRKLWLSPDGSWTGRSRRGLELAGSWTERDGKVCLSQSKPRIPGSMCQALPSDLGAGLEAKDPTGGTVQVKLVKGHKR